MQKRKNMARLTWVGFVIADNRCYDGVQLLETIEWNKHWDTLKEICQSWKRDHLYCINAADH